MKKPEFKILKCEWIAPDVARCLLQLEGYRTKYIAFGEPLPAKIIPPTMTFEQALRSGNTGRILCDPYLRWLKTLPCDTCGAGAPSDPSHFNGYKGAGTKAPDILSIPQCRSCHELYEIGPSKSGMDPKGRPFLERVALYHVQAMFAGRLAWVEG